MNHLVVAELRRVCIDRHRYGAMFRPLFSKPCCHTPSQVPDPVFVFGESRKKLNKSLRISGKKTNKNQIWTRYLME